jgi:hypothetical protein
MQADLQVNKFIAAYISNGGKPRLAAIDAGIEEKQASVYASRWLKKKEVRTKIQKAKERVMSNLVITQNDVLVHLWDIVVNKIEYEPKDRISAIKEVNRMLGFLAQPETTQVTNNNTVVVLPSNKLEDYRILNGELITQQTQNGDD